MAVTYLETGSTNPYYNLAFEEYVLANRKDGDYLLLWQNDNTIVVGQNQNTEAEINRSFVEEHNIRVVRRGTGGGAVYHDLGNLNYSFISDANGIGTSGMTRFTEPIVAALQGLGMHAEASGRNDILAEGRKVSGTAQRLSGNRILYHGTLLFDSNPDMVAGALQVDPTKFQSKSTKSVRSRIGNIRSFLKEDMDLPAFWAYLKKVLAADGIVQGALSSEELAAVDALKENKYDTWEWNFGRSPNYTLRSRKRFAGGGVEVLLSVEQGHIQDAAFYGDFLSLRSLTPLIAALRGCPFRESEVAAVLRRFPISEYFGTITVEELLEVIFHPEA